MNNDIQREINNAGRKIKSEEARKKQSGQYRYSYQNGQKTNSTQRQNQQRKTTYQQQTTQTRQPSKVNHKQTEKRNENGCLSFVIAFWIRSFVLSAAIYLAMQFLNSLVGNDYVINRQSKVGVPMFNTTQEDTQDEVNEVVLTAMNENYSLTDDEKKIIESLDKIILENPYLDKAKAKKQLSEIEIEYTKKDSRYKDNTVGIYDYNTNTIRMFSDKNKTSKRNVAHELVHGIFYNENTANIPSFMQEGVTQELVDEYLSNVPCYEESTYPFEIAAVKLLCEMTDSDTVLKTYTTGDMSVLNNELSKVMPYDKSEEFISNIEEVFKNHREGKEVNLETLANIIRYADSYFTANNSDVYKLEAYNYYRGILQQLGTDEPRVGLNMYLSEKGIYVKPYFSEHLKANYDGPYYYDYRDASRIRNGKEAKEYIRY